MRNTFLILLFASCATWASAQQEAVNRLLRGDLKIGKVQTISRIPYNIAVEEGVDMDDGGVLIITPPRYATQYENVTVSRPRVSGTAVSLKLDTLRKELQPPKKGLPSSLGIRPLPNRHCMAGNQHYEFMWEEARSTPPVYYTDYKIKPGYEETFPNGLMQIQMQIEYKTLSAYPSHEWMPLSGWDSTGKQALEGYGHDYIYTDDEGNYYVVFPKGVYGDKAAEIPCAEPVVETPAETPDTDEPEISVEDIQKALNEKGYNIDVTGEMDEMTRQALAFFQMAHSIPEGDANEDTLKALGLIGE